MKTAFYVLKVLLLAAFTAALASCRTTGGDLDGNNVVVHPLAGAFDECSPYYYLNYITPDKIACEGFGEAYAKALELARKGERTKAWDAVSGSWRNGNCSSDFNALLAMTILLGAVLDEANMFVQMRMGPTYQKLNMAAYKLGKDDARARLLHGILLMRAPGGLGGDLGKGYALVFDERNKDAGETFLAYCKWYASVLKKDTQTASQNASAYLKKCPNRKEAKDWCESEETCKPLITK